MSNARDPQVTPAAQAPVAEDAAELTADALEAVSGGVIEGGCTGKTRDWDSEWSQHGGGACSCCA